MITQKIIL